MILLPSCLSFSASLSLSGLVTGPVWVDGVENRSFGSFQGSFMMRFGEFGLYRGDGKVFDSTDAPLRVADLFIVRCSFFCLII